MLSTYKGKEELLKKKKLEVFFFDLFLGKKSWGRQIAVGGKNCQGKESLFIWKLKKIYEEF